jgi:hypothetical protein
MNTAQKIIKRYSKLNSISKKLGVNKNFPKDFFEALKDNDLTDTLLLDRLFGTVSPFKGLHI